MKWHTYRVTVGLILLAICCVNCVEPTEPDFQIENPFYLVEGRITSEPGLSSVRVRLSAFREIQLRFTDIDDADVVAVEEAGTRVQWIPVTNEPGNYRAPEDFAVSAGERWHLELTLPDGTQLESIPETVPEPVPIDAIKVEFAQESRYDQDRQRFIPAFRILLDYQDPAGRNNYYEWQHRYWEKVLICCSRLNAEFVGGQCLPRSAGSRYDYLCPSEPPCFRETPGDTFVSNDDEFSDGSSVKERLIGEIAFQDFGGLLVEALQYSITPQAYEYNKVLLDIINGSSGLNATIPAALTGNMRNLDSGGPEVLGYVGVSTVSSSRLYLERTEDTGIPIHRDRNIRLAPTVGASVPPPAPCAGMGLAPVTPQGWPE